MRVHNCEDQSDEMLMMRVVAEREVFACLVNRYEDKMRRYLKRLMPGLGDEADDVLQEIFIKVYVHARGFDTSLSFSSWIYRIAHNEAVSWLRKRKARPETVELGEDDFHTFVESVADASEHGEKKLTEDAVARVLVCMREEYRAILVLKFLEGKNYEEISDILQIPQGTVATHIHRAKKEFISLYTAHHAK